MPFDRAHVSNDSNVPAHRSPLQQVVMKETSSAAGKGQQNIVIVRSLNFERAQLVEPSVDGLDVAKPPLHGAHFVENHVHASAAQAHVTRIEVPVVLVWMPVG